MNTLQLDNILTRALRKCAFLGVFASDQLPSKLTVTRPLALVVNTDPSHMSGSHWLAIYVDSSNTASFFDSFGNPPEKFPASIGKFLTTNCADVQYSTRAIQSLCSAVCGQHCVFFLFHMEKREDYGFVIAKFKQNTHLNDVKVCRFVKRLQPSVSCQTFINLNCIQCAVTGELMHCN